MCLFGQDISSKCCRLVPNLSSSSSSSFYDLSPRHNAKLVNRFKKIFAKDRFDGAAVLQPNVMACRLSLSSHHNHVFSFIIIRRSLSLAAWAQNEREHFSSWFAQDLFISMAHLIHHGSSSQSHILLQTELLRQREIMIAKRSPKSCVILICAIDGMSSMLYCHKSAHGFQIELHVRMTQSLTIKQRASATDPSPLNALCAGLHQPDWKILCIHSEESCLSSYEWDRLQNVKECSVVAPCRLTNDKCFDVLWAGRTLQKKSTRAIWLHFSFQLHKSRPCE